MMMVNFWIIFILKYLFDNSVTIMTFIFFFTFSCDCPDGFEGPRCQKLRQSFDGTGYALYKQLEQCEESRTSIEFMTKKATAVILYNGPVSELEPVDPRDFLLLELVNGKPRLRINHGTGEIGMEITGGSSLNDGAWHRIDIFRDRKVN